MIEFKLAAWPWWDPVARDAYLGAFSPLSAFHATKSRASGWTSDGTDAEGRVRSLRHRETGELRAVVKDHPIQVITEAEAETWIIRALRDKSHVETCTIYLTPDGARVGISRGWGIARIADEPLLFTN